MDCGVTISIGGHGQALPLHAGVEDCIPVQRTNKMRLRMR
jgi:hypothetical protein